MRLRVYAIPLLTTIILSGILLRWLSTEVSYTRSDLELAEKHTEHFDSPADTHLNIAYVLTLKNPEDELVLKFSRSFSSLLHRARIKPLRVIIFTNQDSIGEINEVTRRLIKYKAKTEIQVEYYNFKEIGKRFHQKIAYMKDYFMDDNPQATRFVDDIFFFSQLLHKIIPYEKIIMLDADTVLRIDPYILYLEFKKFSGPNVIGMAYDQAVHYRIVFRFYKEDHSDTLIGEPHPGYQGLNSGVILFDLEKMRKSRLYNSLLNPRKIDELCDKYKFKSHLGDQDFFTLIGAEFFELFHILDCVWNRQLDISMKRDEHRDIFDKYHNCKGDVKIYHGVGGSEIPFDIDWWK